MSKTDKTRPHRVKMYEDPANYREVHNHAWRYLRDKDGKIVTEETGAFFDKDKKYPIVRRLTVPFDGNCDLPAIPDLHASVDWERCHYDGKRSWQYQGSSGCGCKRCTMQDERKMENRSERRNGKRKDINERLHDQ